LASLGGKLKNVNSTIGTLTGDRQQIQNSLQALSQNKADWRRMFNQAWLQASHGSTVALQEKKN
jgi:hypothetical protein